MPRALISVSTAVRSAPPRAKILPATRSKEIRRVIERLDLMLVRTAAAPLGPQPARPTASATGHHSGFATEHRVEHHPVIGPPPTPMRV
jgi:hypothetical protein